MKTKLILSMVLATTISITATQAEEGASGHYLPGLTASYFDALPDKPGLAAFNFFTMYGGNSSASRPLDFAGDIGLGVRADLKADTIGMVYQTNLSLWGGKYATAVALPFVWVDVHAQSALTGPKGTVLVGKNLVDHASGLGDITIYPFMLGWQAFGGDLKYDVRLGVYAPTGSYDVGQLANTGKNYWTVEPGASVTWLSKTKGTEVTAFAAFDANSENTATNYQTGAQFHLDITAAQHLPLLGGIAGVGANAFYYQQITDDSGSGANLGAFQGRTVGIGPVVSYARKIGTVDCFAEVKWLPELEVQNRTEGDYIWVKIGAQF